MSNKRGPRVAKLLARSTDAWWYDDKTGIDIFAREEIGDRGITLGARIEKRHIISWLRRLGYTVTKAAP